MADDDFDLDSLAEFLHVAPHQVQRLVERGKVPARRIAGQWRFSKADIHHWLEQKIGIADEAELVGMEAYLREPLADAPEPVVALVEMLPREAIAVPLAARTRGSVIRSMTDLAAATGWLWDPERMATAIQEREDMAPTALDNGVALLHPRRPMPSILGQSFLAFGRTDQGIPFGGSRLTDLFFLILSIDDHGHLRTLARLSRLLTSEDFVHELRAAPDVAAVQQLFEQAEAKLE